MAIVLEVNHTEEESTGTCREEVDSNRDNDDGNITFTFFFEEKNKTSKQ